MRKQILIFGKNPKYCYSKENPAIVSIYAEHRIVYEVEGELIKIYSLRNHY